MHKEQTSIVGHGMSVTTLEFSPDGKYLISGSSDKTLILWTVDGRFERTFKGHSKAVNDCSWCPDSIKFCSVSDDGTVRIWDRETFSNPRILQGHLSSVLCNDFSPSGNLIVSGSVDGTCRIWDVNSGDCIFVLAAHSDTVVSSRFNMDGTLVATASHDGLIRLWDVATGQCLKTVQDMENAGTQMYGRLISSSIIFSPNGELILAAYMNNQLKLFAYDTGKVLKLYRGHHNTKFSLDTKFFTYGTESYIACASEDGSICIFDVQKCDFVEIIMGHKDTVLSISCHPSLPIIASSAIGTDLRIKFWEYSFSPK